LLSRDLHTAGLLVVPNDTIAAAGERETWIVAVRTLAAQHARHGRHTYVAGTPLEQHDVAQYLQRDQQLTIPLVFLVLLGITWWLYTVWRLALIPLACVLLSLLWTMGIVGYTGIPLNIITSLLPPVIMVVSISTALHVINQYLTDSETVGQGAEAVERTM
jgi:hypothetical protein